MFNCGTEMLLSGCYVVTRVIWRFFIAVRVNRRLASLGACVNSAYWSRKSGERKSEAEDCIQSVNCVDHKPARQWIRFRRSSHSCLCRWRWKTVRFIAWETMQTLFRKWCCIQATTARVQFSWKRRSLCITREWKILSWSPEELLIHCIKYAETHYLESIWVSEQVFLIEIIKFCFLFQKELLGFQFFLSKTKRSSFWRSIQGT